MPICKNCHNKWSWGKTFKRMFTLDTGMNCPICKNCHNKWSWGQTFKRMFTLDTGMNCPYCEEKQYQTRKSKKKTGVLNFLVPLPLLLNLLFDFPPGILLSSFPILFFLIMSL